MESIYKKISEIENSAQNAALCIIINTQGSTSRKPGTKMLVFDDKQIYGTIGGGNLEIKVINDALAVMKKNTPQTFNYVLEKDLEMSCGGTVEIYLEPVMNRKKLYIFGAGHIGRILAAFANRLDFNVTLIDERNGIFDDWNTDKFTIINKAHKPALKELIFDKNTFIAVITHKHDYDKEIVAFCAKQPNAYLGMIGSKRKIEKIKNIYIKEKILTQDEMKNIDWPMGIKIDCQTPEEIAISILAKLIDVRGKLV